MSETDDQKKWSAPPGAYREPVAYDSHTDSFPREIEYGAYRRLGIMKNTGQSASAARRAALAKYGPRAKVYMTARYWVCYDVA